MSDAISNLLDATLDDLADMPEFKPFPNGAHKATIEFIEKVVNKKDSVEVKFTAIETIELADPVNDKPLEKGATASVLCQLHNEMGQGSLKEILKPLGVHYNLTKLREIMATSKGTEVAIATKQHADKDDPNKKYMGIVSLLIV